MLRGEAISVYCPDWVIRRFKKVAKEYFPKECFAYLYGQIDKHSARVEGLWFPDNLAASCFESQVLVEGHWAEEAKEYAREHDAVVIGDIHSHPWKQTDLAACSAPDHSQSEADFDKWKHDWWKVNGICLIRELKNKTLRASVKFWGPTVPLNVNITPVQPLQRLAHDDES